MADTTWEQRTRTLNQAGYARYDESTSRMLGDTAAMLLDRYQGDLRRLRDAAQRIPGASGPCSRNARGRGRRRRHLPPRGAGRVGRAVPVRRPARARGGRAERTMAAYCAAVGIEDREDALSWEAGAVPEWQNWAEGHRNAEQSSGILPAAPDGAADQLPARVQATVEMCPPHYQRLYAERPTV